MSVNAQEIGFTEEFALAKDRTVPLGQLIPGTQEYYFFHCLHYQNTQQLEKADQMLADWQRRHRDNDQIRQMRYRQALLTYERSPQQTLDFLKKELGLSFSHQRIRADRKPDVPPVFDERLLARERQLLTAMQRANMDGFEDSALRWLMRTRLDPDRRRALLARLQRPDYDNLPEHIAADLQHRNSGGFGSLPIHSLLTKAQLDELLELRPQLRNETNFVNTYIARLAVSADVDITQQSDEYRDWLQRLRTFADTLAPSHNSLKAHILYHQLAFDLQTGDISRDRFMDYIRLPRQAPYVNTEWLRSGAVSRYLSNLSEDFSAVTSLRPVGSDEELIRSYLLTFFVKDAGYKDFEPYLSDVYLRHLFAEAKIVNGLGDAEQWYALLPPEKYQALRERVDIDFAPANRRFFTGDEAVALDVSIKNVKDLIVKVFEINTLNYHRENQRDVNTDVNLDGLVANDEQTHHYDDPPLRRVTRRFEFPELNRRGTYVIDFIGNGRSSRALIRKGRLRFIEQTTAVGHSFTVLDEQNEVVRDARLYLGGQQYDAMADGRIMVPFTTEPGSRKVVIAGADDFSMVGDFDHQAEQYTLAAHMYTDRESLLRQRTAKLIIRPQLLINGHPVSLSLLEDVKLTITSTDHDGVQSMQEYSLTTAAESPRDAAEDAADDAAEDAAEDPADHRPILSVADDRETVHEFAVPPRLASLQFSLRGTVKQLTTATDVAVSDSHSVTVNGIERTENIVDVHLLKSGDNYEIELRGRSGEMRAGQPLRVELKHRDFRTVVAQTLASDENGRILLGSLEGVTRVTVKGSASKSWELSEDRHSGYDYAVIHAATGDEVRVPWTGASELSREYLTLLELRRGTFAADHFERAELRDGFLVITGLPPGDYHLETRRPDGRSLIRVTDGRKEGRMLLGRNRQLEIRGSDPVQIESVSSDEDSVTIRLQSAGKFTRVHLLATRYLPEFNAFHDLAATDAQPFAKSAPLLPLSAYVEGRNIGDEYRYILERRASRRFPGNMNERPGLLLNPFVLRSTDTGSKAAAAGVEFNAAAEAPGAEVLKRTMGGRAGGESGGFACLDFLPQSSLVVLNLIPGDDGTITVDIDRLGGRHHLRVIAADTLHTVMRSHSLTAPEPSRVDLRLADSLDPEKHFNQSRQFRVVAEGEQLINDETSSVRMQAIDSLARLYQLFGTLNGSDSLTEFEFILRWPTLNREEKQELYSKYACHELHFFIARRDPKFFEEVVRPYLDNKLHKTFMDHYLLESDLRGYLRPWHYARLNTAEQILLSDRIEGEIERTRTLISNRADLVPTDLKRQAWLFDTAFAGMDLSDSGRSDPAAVVLQGAEDDGIALGGSAVSRFGLPAPSGGRAFFGRPGSQEEAESMPLSGSVDARGRSVRQRRAGTTRGAERKLGEIADMEDRAESSDGAEDQLGLAFRKSRAAQADAYFDDNAVYELRLQQGVQNLYRRLEAVQEYAENNYYRLPIEQQVAELITASRFWSDYAARDRNAPFVSRHVADASRSFTEMMLALAVTDLPFETPEHRTEVKDGVAVFTAGGPMIAAIDEILPAEMADHTASVLVSQNFYQQGDRYRHVGAQQLDRFITEEFVINTVYGCQVAVTNPTSAPRELTLVLQIPAGAVPVMNSHYTRRVTIALQPFTTQTHDYHFYFPDVGDFSHYPVQITENGRVAAFADAVKFHVVEKPTTVDRDSWDYVSQSASSEQVLEFLSTQNLQRIDLARIAWRMKDSDFFAAVTDLLHKRHLFDDTLWSYAVHHNAPGRISEFLASHGDFAAGVGPQIDSPLLTVDPVERHTYQHRDYRPLVNARAHRLGASRTILNDRFRSQYQSLMNLLAYQPDADDEQKMAVTYYLLLQDRVAEASELFAEVNPDRVAARIQYDYCAAYLDFFDDDPAIARAMCDRYADFPVDRWRNLFASMKSQLDELDGEAAEATDPEQTQQMNNQLADADSSFDLNVDYQTVSIAARNVETLTVNYYLMDIELLFSRNPFVQQYGSRFSNIRPNLTSTVEVPDGEQSITFDLPAELRNSNVLVEVAGRGMKKTAAYYSNSLTLNISENYGQVRVTDAESGRGLSRVYVKAYARMNNGEVKFYKDGYTDLRGRFDYAGLNTPELNNVDRFSLLILSDSHGATVREAGPPQS